MDREILGNDCVDRLGDTIVRGTAVCDIDAVGDSSTATLDRLPQSRLKLRNGDRLMFASIHPTLSRRHERGGLVNETD